jgi:predicted O-linked N-acetylglucosamine transferase (SPINDLY family)
MKPRSNKKQASHELLARAVAMQEQGLLDEAERLFHASLALNSRNQWALYSLGVIALSRQDSPRALQFLDRAVTAAPHLAALWHARGAVLARLDRREDGLDSLNRAIKLDPHHVDALNDSAALLLKISRRKDALERLRQVLSIEPDAKALFNISTILAESIVDADLVQSVAYLEQLVALYPNHNFAVGQLAYQKLHLCNWSNFAHANQEVIGGVRAGNRSCSPIPFMVMSSEACDQQTCAITYAKSFFPPPLPPLWQGEPYVHERIRIAYVSPDFRDHPVGQLMAGVLERHDKSRFEVIAISVSHDDGGSRRKRLVAAVEQFIDAENMTTREMASLMHRMEIDIAVDLAGYTAQTGSAIFSHRPAPVQVNFLGFPGTLGTDFMDYILADRHVIPPENTPFFNEKVLYLPDAYLPTDDSLEASPNTPSRTECGLPEIGFVFCAFSHDHKISPSLFEVWMRLLRQIPGSVLWLMSRTELSANNLRKEAELREVDSSRLLFATRLPQIEDHLARYRQADLFLDTYPYNAHTTAADALSVGLPVITCMGNAFPSRVAGSLLHAIGLSELITHSIVEYETLALKLASDPGQLAAVKAKLRTNHNTHPLFKTELYCRNLETAFEKIYVGRCPAKKESGDAVLQDSLMQAVLLQQNGRDVEAEALFRKCNEINPKHPLPLYGIGTILVARNNPSVALDFLDQAVSEASPYAPLWFAHGIALAQSGRREDALASYEEALKLDPNHLPALTNSCILQQDLRRPQAAQALHLRILALTKDTAS